MAVFRTSKLIERLTSVILFYDGAPVTIEISKSCYEESDYNALFDTNSVYPYSKAYALKYKFGGNTISELNHVIKHRYDPAFSTPAIINIAARENASFSVPTDYADLMASY